MTEILPKHTVVGFDGPRFDSRQAYALAYPQCQGYPPTALCSPTSAVPGCDYVARDAYWFGDEGGQAWLVTFSRHRADLLMPRGQGRGNVVACNVGMIGPPLRWAGTGEVLVLAGNIAMDIADALLTERPRPNTLADVVHRLR